MTAEERAIDLLKQHDQGSLVDAKTLVGVIRELLTELEEAYYEPPGEIGSIYVSPSVGVVDETIQNKP